MEAARWRLWCRWWARDWRDTGAEMALALETRAAEVSIARLAHPRPMRRIGMVWRKSNPLAQEFAKIAAAVRKLGVAQKAEAGWPSRAERLWRSASHPPVIRHWDRGIFGRGAARSRLFSAHPFSSRDFAL